MYFIKLLARCNFIIVLCWLPLNALNALPYNDFKSVQALTLGLTKPIPVENDSNRLESAYRKFQNALKNQALSEFRFEFANDFKANPQNHHKLFAQIRQADEKFYFYYDTGRMLSHSRGFALTNKSLIWKNLVGKASRLQFDNIKTITLLHEHGLSLTGWKLQISTEDGRNKAIRLSRIEDNAVIPFTTAIIEFINANKTVQGKNEIQFNLPDREKGIVAGWITLCGKKHISQDNPIKELQLLDACFFSYGSGFELSTTDIRLLNQLTIPIFADIDVSFVQGYNNFKIVLSTHFFSDLEIKFKNNFDNQIQAEIFPTIRPIGEKYAFYFNNGNLTFGSRGIALTDKAIIWKNLLGSEITWENLTGSATRLTFAKISSVALIHEIDVSSITGWKLRLNDNYDIGLSKLSSENVELFALALVYYINLADKKANLILQVPHETREVLTKSFLERHPQLQSITDSVVEVFTPDLSE